MSITGPDRKGRAGKQDEVEDGLGQDEEVQNSHSYSGSSRQLPMEPCMEPRRDSVFPPQWRITHSSRQLAQVLASGLSLIAFILLLVMLFSKKWLCLSKSRFYQRWPTNVSKRIYTSAHLMSMGPLQICKSKSCSNSENGKGETLQPLNLTLGLQPALASTSAPLYSRPFFWPSPVYWPARWSLALRLPRIDHTLSRDRVEDLGCWTRPPGCPLTFRVWADGKMMGRPACQCVSCLLGSASVGSSIAFCIPTEQKWEEKNCLLKQSKK